MRVKSKENRRRAGYENYQKRVEAVGIENIKEAGREYAKRRKTFAGGCSDREFASTIGKRGGAHSRRSRKIDPNENLRSEEWVRLREMAVTTAGQLRKEEVIDTVTWTKLKNLDLQLAEERKDWKWVMNSAVDYKSWRSRLGIYLYSQRDWYKNCVLADVLTPEQKEDYRIIRNLIAAWKVAGETLNGEESKAKS